MRSTIFLLPLAALVLEGCGPSNRPHPSAVRAAGREPVAMLELPDRSRWTPESGEGAETLGKLPDGTSQMVLQRLRIELTPTGGLRRAHDLLPTNRGGTSAMALPDRLGGGHLFVSTSSGSTLWRARTFLGRLEALVKLPSGAVQVAAGVDRLLVRSPTSDRTWGVDPDTGAIEAPLPLPPAPRFGPITFVDGWRGAVFADLQGLLVTHDAGATWRPVAVTEAPRQLTAEGGLVAAQLTSGRVRIDPDTGAVIDGAGVPVAAPASSARTATRGPWGAARPLRVAIEDGWPLLDGTSVAMRQGRVGRVRLEDGEVLEASFTPIPGEETASCQAVRFGVDVGFVCGAPGRGTTVYAYEPPTSARLVMSFDAPRAVMPSQNGWLVVRGGCARDATPAPGRYCVVGPAGAAREVSAVGNVGVERVVALSDGRVAVVVPPRDTDGQLLILPAVDRPGAIQALALRPDENAPILRRGLWLDGMSEVAPGELGGWSEASGLLAGVRVKLDDGSATAGPLQEGTHVAIAGQRAFSALGADQMNETLDGGLTWKPVIAPPALGQGKLQPGLHCGAGGCAIPFERGAWVRVGWGAPVDPTDLEEAPERPAAAPERIINTPLRMTCEVVRRETRREPPTPGAMTMRMYPPGLNPMSDPSTAPPPIVPFQGVAPPTTPAGSLQLSEGTATGAPARLYGWVPRGVAAGRSGRAQLRFFDRFDPVSPVRSTALSQMPWRDEQALRDAFGLGAGSLALHSLIDPSGRAMLLASCQNAGCELHGAVAGRPLIPLPLPDEDTMARVFSPSASAVWLDESFYLAHNMGSQVTVWRLEPDQPRQLARLPRITGFNNMSSQVTLVRRARSRQLGLLSRGGGQPGRSDVDLFVLPIDPTSGQVGTQIRLGPADLSWTPTRVCGADDDGWLIDVSLPVQPVLRMPAGVRMNDIEVRARLDPSSVCIDALSAQLIDDGAPSSRGPQPPAPRPAAPPATASVTLAASSDTQRLVATCVP